jgi:hypothetical protein
MGIDDTLVRWLEEEQEIRARLAATGIARAEQLRGRSGLQICARDDDLPDFR